MNQVDVPAQMCPLHTACIEVKMAMSTHDFKKMLQALVQRG